MVASGIRRPVSKGLELMNFGFDIVQNLMILYMQDGQPKGVQCVDGLKTGITIRLSFVTGN